MISLNTKDNQIAVTVMGQFTLEAGIYEPTVPEETGDTTNLDPLRAANGNIALLGQGDGIGQERVELDRAHGTSLGRSVQRNAIA